MNRPSHFFDIQSAEQLFHLLKTVANTFTSSEAKRMQDLLLLVFGLTHLREWIAPDFNPKRPPVTPGEQFFQDIYMLDEFKVLQALCNRSKHMSPTDSVMGILHTSTIDEWPDVDSVSDFDLDPPTAYSVDDRDVEDVIRVAIKFYEDHWFRKAQER